MQYELFAFEYNMEDIRYSFDRIFKKIPPLFESCSSVNDNIREHITVKLINTFKFRSYYI
jgi:hypothetical protein